MKTLGKILLTLVVLAIPLYFWFFTTSEGAESAWPIEMTEVRRLAKSMPGERPTDVRVEEVAVFAFPSNAIVAGSGWQPWTMATYSYQLVFPTRTAIIDTGIPQAEAKSELRASNWDTAAFKRMEDAVLAADFILVTHEHCDHLGGLATHPNPDKVFARAMLTPEQLANAKGLKPLTLPSAGVAAVKPLSYDKYAAIAPGVVVIKTPGHTPGSQLVYVERADGIEMLFLGDVAWQTRNVDEVRERARLVTTMLGEDRAKVLQQLQTFNDFKKSEPALVQVPGHDREAIEALVSKGLMHKGFVVAAAPTTAPDAVPTGAKP